VSGVAVETWRKAFLHLACGGLCASGLLGVVLPLEAQQASVSQQSSELPDSPGVLVSRVSAPFRIDGAAGPSQASAPVAAPIAQPEAAQSQTPQAQANATQESPAPQKPVGTAAAGAPETSGIAASQPAGVAIAPAKQRRVRTIILRTGAIIGAGVAVGAVVAMTEATPSKPPGAH
jgi:hypothetical protein